MTVDYSIRDGVAVITLDDPPVNRLGHSTRLGIVEGIQRAGDDPNVRAIVLIGAGKAFSRSPFSARAARTIRTRGPSLTRRRPRRSRRS